MAFVVGVGLLLDWGALEGVGTVGAAPCCLARADASVDDPPL